MLCEFLAGLAAAVVGFGIFWALLRLPWLSRLDTYLGGDKAGVFTGLFLGTPMGAVLGIFMFDKILLKAAGYNLVGIGIGLGISFVFGGIGSVVLMSKFGGHAVFIAPFLFVVLALVGYMIPSHKWGFGWVSEKRQRNS